MSDFQLLYPLWLLAIPFWLLLLYILYRYKKSASNYEEMIDVELRGVLIQGENTSRKPAFIIAGLVGVWLLIALAGPSLHSEKVPLYEVQQGLVIALDLSTSMLTGDVQPNRLQRARFELHDLLKLRKEGQTGLVVFAGDAFVVAPMTPDTDTVLLQTQHLEPGIMPAQGSRMDRAIEESVNLLKHADYNKGHILLLTDGAHDLPLTVEAADKAVNEGYEVSILAIGSQAGGTIPLAGGGVLRDKQGKAVVARLDMAALQEVADAGNGVLTSFNITDSDTRYLHSRYKLDKDFELNGNRQLVHPVNDGIWMLFPLVIAVAALFRKAYILAVFLMAVGINDPVYAFDWQSLWLNKDQMGKKALQQGRAAEALHLFEEKAWQAAAAYRAGNYVVALELYEQMDTVTSWYNRGNVLVQMDRPAEAINAYQEVLRRDPEHQDARFNLNLLIRIEEQKFIQSYQSRGKQEMVKDQQKTGEKQKTEPPDGEEGRRDQDLQQAIRDREDMAYKNQWLKSIPDDPAGLWRNKFRYQYRKRGQLSEVEPW